MTRRRSPAQKPPTKDLVTPLKWEAVASRLQRARVEEGAYVLVATSLGDWAGEWHPAKKGRVRALVIQTTQDLARTACEHHHIQRCTNTLLLKNDAADLTRPEMLGAPVASRFRR